MAVRGYSLEESSQPLGKIGYVDCKNIAFERGDAGGYRVLVHDQAAEPSGLKVDAIVVESTPAAVAAKKATRRIPVVFIAGSPVGSGFLTSLARPGRAIRGLPSLTPELTAKRLELLREATPLEGGTQ